MCVRARVCVCVRVRVRARALARVCACVHACLSVYVYMRLPRVCRVTFLRDKCKIITVQQNAKH